MAGVYTFLAADLITNAILAELPLDQCTFERKLNNAGTMSAQLPLGDASLAKIDPIGSTQPGRTALYVDRDGVLIWGGIIWTRNYDSTQQLLQIGGNEFWSYFQHRSIRTNELFTSTTDQLTIFETIMNYAQAQSGGNIGVTIPGTTCGVTRTMTEYSYQRSALGQTLQDLSALDNGFDFTIEVTYAGTPAVPTKNLVLSYPRRGVISASSGLLFEMPGNIVSYQWPEDATKMANTVDAIGAGNDVNTRIGSAQGAASITAGWPLIEDVLPLKSETVQANLDARATAEVKARQFPIILPTVIVRADMDPVVGSYTVGDEARFRIADERFYAAQFGAAAIDAAYRIQSYTIQPPGSNNPEQVTFVLGPTL